MIATCRSRHDFGRIAAEGRATRHRLLWARVVIDLTMTECRVAFALGRQLGNAVTRNRLRRRLRAILNHHDHDLAPGLLLIGATPQAIGVGYARLDAAATEVLSAAEVLGAGVPDGASAASVEPAP